MSLALPTILGAFWSFGELLAKRGITAFVTVVLAYLLVPQDFGLIAIVALFLAVSTTLMDSGMKDALIRRRRLTSRTLETAFWASLATGFVAFLVLVVLAPWAASFYEQPQLTALIRVGGFAVVLTSIQLVPSARLANALNFKMLLRASVPASMVSGVIAIALAFLGLGIWSLMAQILIQAAIASVILWCISGVKIQWRLHGRTLLSLWRFGYKLSLSTLIATVARNVVPSIIGKAISLSAAGYFYFVDKMMEMLMGQLVYAVQNATLPALARMQSESDRLKAAYRRVLQVSMFVTAPVLAIAAALADPIFGILFAPKWHPAAEYFRILCASNSIYCLHAINLNLLKVKGRSDLFLKLEVIKAVILAVALVLTVKHGISAVLYGLVAVSLLCYVPNSYYAKSLIGYSINEQFRDFIPYLLAAALTYLVVSYVFGMLGKMSDILAIMVSALLGAIIYIVICMAGRLQAPVMILRVLSRN